MMIAMENTMWFNSGARIISFAAWTTFLNEFPSWLGHVFGLQKAVWPMGSVIGQSVNIYIPFALLDFCISTIMSVLYSISILLLVVFTFSSFKYEGNMSTVYPLCALFCLLAGGASGCLAWLLWQASNHSLKNMLKMYTDGNEMRELEFPGAAAEVTVTVTTVTTQYNVSPPAYQAVPATEIPLYK